MRGTILAMELKDLNGDETLAMAALLKFVVFGDSQVTEEEREEIDLVVEEIGEDRYRAAMDEADVRFADEDALKAFLSKIERPEARELIFGMVFEAALIDAIEGRESEILEWLRAAWNIEVEYEEPAAPIGDA